MFFDAIITGAPVVVEIAGAPVPINSGFRRALVFSTMEEDSKAIHVARMLNLFFAKNGLLPDQVSKYPAEALSSATEWFEGAYDTMKYGEQYKSHSLKKRIFDWQEDAGIVAADFMRFYGLDLTSPHTQLHWYTFVNLYMGLIATQGSLISQAMAARSPLTGETTKEAERVHARQARAWALPLTEDELREQARLNF